MKIQKLILSTLFLMVCIFFVSGACASTGHQQIESQDSSYGYTEDNPIKVGGIAQGKGPENERNYLNRLRGPNGQKINYKRVGSCCAFKTSKGFLGSGLLDMYEVTYEGLNEPVTLYLNFYEFEALKAPIGFQLTGE